MNWAVILAGGSGTRFWPLSTPTRPKQVLPLVGDRSTAEEAVARLDGLVQRDRILLVTGQALADPLAGALDLPAANVLVEPRARGTGPALAWATHDARRRDPDAVVLSLHADWHVPDAGAFARVAAAALGAARDLDLLITVGVEPSRPESGYGYIVPGEPLGGTPPVARRVARFTEKPNPAEAAGLIAAGALWNSGLFAWPATTALAQLARWTPEIAPVLPALDAGDVAGFFAGVSDVTIDVGLLERSDRVGVVPGDFAWDDIGTWEALARIRRPDDRGNVTVGPVTLVECTDTVAWSEQVPIVLSGVRNLVVVEANGRILVMDRSRAGDLKQILDRLPGEVREL